MTHRGHEYNYMLNDVCLFVGYSGHLVEIACGILNSAVI